MVAKAKGLNTQKKREREVYGSERCRGLRKGWKELVGDGVEPS